MLAAAIRASLIEADEHQASSSSQNGKPQPRPGDQRHSSASTQESKTQHSSDQAQSGSSKQGVGNQQADKQQNRTSPQQSQSPFGATQPGSISKPPRNHLPSSRSAAALFSMDQGPSLAPGPHQQGSPQNPKQQGSPNGCSSSASQQQHAHHGRLESEMQKIDLQAGPSKQAEQGSSALPSEQPSLHQSQSQPALANSVGMSAPSQDTRRQSRDSGQDGQFGNRMGAKQGSPEHQEHGSQKHQHRPRSALQSSGK